MVAIRIYNPKLRFTNHGQFFFPNFFPSRTNSFLKNQFSRRLEISTFEMFYLATRQVQRQKHETSARWKFCNFVEN